jgi:hypothetical protein
MFSSSSSPLTSFAPLAVRMTLPPCYPVKKTVRYVGPYPRQADRPPSIALLERPPPGIQTKYWV